MDHRGRTAEVTVLNEKKVIIGLEGRMADETYMEYEVGNEITLAKVFGDYTSFKTFVALRGKCKAGEWKETARKMHHECIAAIQEFQNETLAAVGVSTVWHGTGITPPPKAVTEEPEKASKKRIPKR